MVNDTTAGTGNLKPVWKLPTGFGLRNLRCQKRGFSYYNAQRRNYAKHQARMDPSCWHDKCEFSVARVVIEQSKSSQLIFHHDNFQAYVSPIDRFEKSCASPRRQVKPAGNLGLS